MLDFQQAEKIETDNYFSAGDTEFALRGLPLILFPNFALRGTYLMRGFM